MTFPDGSDFIQRMPKVELHVHLEGSVRPETLLKLAKRHNISLPADDVEGLRRWYTFRDFSHFVEVYMAISSCLRTAEDIELIAREFLAGQAEQNIVYSEVTFTPYNQYFNCGLGFREQMDAVDSARAWGKRHLGVQMGMIIDIPREHPAEAGDRVADWIIERYGEGVIAMGLGGPEKGNPPSKFRRAFGKVRAAGIPCILHAGETDGPESIWSAIEVADTKRVGHGVRAVEDKNLMEHLRKTQLVLEVCPTSNVCLRVYPSLTVHPLPKLFEYGLKITINSDDPPMFNTTLTGEYEVCSQAYGWGKEVVRSLVLNAAEATLLAPADKTALIERLRKELASGTPASERPTITR
jgi:adenosine deaminase